MPSPITNHIATQHNQPAAAPTSLPFRIYQPDTKYHLYFGPFPIKSNNN